MSKIDQIMTVGLLIFWLAVLVLVLLVILVREYLTYKNYISELEKRNQKLEAQLADRDMYLKDIRLADNERLNYFNAVFAAMKDGIVVFKENGELVLVNRAARHFLHIDKHIFFKTDKSAYGAFYEEVAGLCREVYESDNDKTLLFQEGEKSFEISAHLVPDRYQKGTFLGVMAVVTDVTEARRIEARRKEFVSNVSHEFRTPMTLISGYAEMLRMWDEVTKEERNKALDVIEQETKRLKKLVSELLTLSKLDRQEEGGRVLPFVDVEAVIEQIIWSLEDMAAKQKVSLSSDIEVDYPILRANEQFFYQMLLNLVENGIKYNREGGFVRVWARSNDKKLRITVSDDGVGIGQKHQEQIFDRFYRIEEDRNSRHGGNGIGLSIVKNVVDQMNGTIEVDSRPGEGTEFRIELPLSG